MGGVATRLTSSDKVLVVIVLIVALAAAALSGLIALLLASKTATPSAVGAMISFAALLIGTDIGLLHLTLPFDKKHPGFTRGCLASLMRPIRGTFIRLTRG